LKEKVKLQDQSGIVEAVCSLFLACLTAGCELIRVRSTDRVNNIVRVFDIL